MEENKTDKIYCSLYIPPKNFGNRFYETEYMEIIQKDTEIILLRIPFTYLKKKQIKSFKDALYKKISFLPNCLEKNIYDQIFNNIIYKQYNTNEKQNMFIKKNLIGKKTLEFTLPDLCEKWHVHFLYRTLTHIGHIIQFSNKLISFKL